MLFITPTRQFPDHHPLAVATIGSSARVIELPITDAPLEALLRALIVVHNPYQTPKP